MRDADKLMGWTTPDGIDVPDWVFASQSEEVVRG
jgi:hypothetical protein